VTEHLPLPVVQAVGSPPSPRLTKGCRRLWRRLIRDSRESRRWEILPPGPPNNGIRTGGTAIDRKTIYIAVAVVLIIVLVLIFIS
jgi:hypothetical protein